MLCQPQRQLLLSPQRPMLRLLLRPLLGRTLPMRDVAASTSSIIRDHDASAAVASAEGRGAATQQRAELVEKWTPVVTWRARALGARARHHHGLSSARSASMCRL
jgi:hypothetical protein